MTQVVDWVDLTSAATFADGHPWPAYARLRREAPIAWHPEANGPGFWTVLRWADVRAVSRQPQRYSSALGSVMMETPDAMGLAMQRLMMLNMDPPQHDRFKLLVSRKFTPKSAAVLTDRIRALPAQIVNAGGDTTRNLVAAGLQLLFEHPAERARLEADLDGLLPSAIEEMLRFTTPVIYFRRTLTQAVTLGGVGMEAGDKVVMLHGSANRAEDVFTEPDRFDVGRSPNPHMAFGGGGPHLCLGMHVARIEIDALFRQVLTRLPGLESAGERRLMASNFIAGIHSMPVRWDASRAS